MLKTLGSHVRGNVVAYIALFIALGGTTYAATGQPFTLGQSNTANAPTSLTASPSFAGKALQVTNTNTGAGATALGLNVASGHAPFTVNSPTKVANLNADQLDGLDSTSFVPSSGFRRVGPVTSSAIASATIQTAAATRWTSSGSSSRCPTTRPSPRSRNPVPVGRSATGTRSRAIGRLRT